MERTQREKELVEKFLQDTTYFRAPDPKIIYNHCLEPITEREAAAIQTVSNNTISLVRSKLQAAAAETCEMLKQTGAAPGAKWGDLITAIYTESGDLSIASSQGIVLFSTTAQYAVKFTRQYWVDDPSVGVYPGDAFMHNDARYGGVHNADHSMMLPIFHDGQLIAWAGVVVHEGENGAVEPGGVPSLAESKFMEGLMISPIKIAENYTLKNDIVTFLQNSVREPKLLLQDLKVRLTATIRLQQRIEEAINEFGVDAVVATMRKTLDDSDREVRRRVSQWQDGTVRSMVVLDGTLRENVLCKGELEITKKGDTLHFDLTGTSPEFANRAFNANYISLIGAFSSAFLFYVWPDLPRNQAVLNSMKVTVGQRSLYNCSYETPSAQCMASGFPFLMAIQHGLAKFLYSAEERYTQIMAPMYDMITTFLYGGVTQNGEIVGNIAADLNAMPSGGREQMDGEHALTISVGAMADQGEQELFEEDLPWMHLSRRLLQDNQGFGKHRGGSGYQMIVAVKDTPFFGLMSTTIGSKFPTVTGLFGGYGCPTYPLAKVKGVNVFTIMQENPDLFSFTIEEIMNQRPFEGATYSTHHRGMGFEVVQEGELYMLTQGTGGGYGDVLDRDPGMVLKDLEEGIISDYVAQSIYHVVYDPATFALDMDATREKRKQERENRKQRGTSYSEFLEKWVTPEPPAHLPWYGSWGDKHVIYAGSPENKMASDNLQSVYLPDPKDVRIAQLEDQLKQAVNK